MENVKPEAVEDDLSTEKSTTTWIVLFYKYHPLSPDPAVMEVYRSALENLCRSLQLKGRILVGCSSKSAVEGINGTLAGSYDCVRAFTQALLVSDKQQRQDQQHKQHSTQEARMNTSDSLNVQSAAIGSVVKEFQSKSREFFLKIGQAELRFESPDDFKWSSVTTKTRRENTDNDTSAIVNWSSNNDALHSTKGMEEEEEINDLFPDLRIKLVDELIGTGGALSHISLEETSLGYLTPKEWHQRLLACRNISHFRRATAMDPSSESQSSTTATQQVDQHDGSAQHLDSTCGNKKDDDQRAISNGDTVLIDCRNTKEYAIGHFAGAIDPQTTTFAQFPKWVDQNKLLLENKTVLMYCTGGIRCEKASAYIRQTIPSVQEVCHLKGGIHKYLEDYGNDHHNSRVDTNYEPLWYGRNFVFDGRGAASGSDTIRGKDPLCQSRASETDTSNSELTQIATAASSVLVVGRCVDCESPFDCFDPRCVCTVCREPTLVCHSCRDSLAEYHCRNHRHLRACYFTDLNVFSVDDLVTQLDELSDHLCKISVGRRFKQKRKTLQKQIDRLMTRISVLSPGDTVSPTGGVTHFIIDGDSIDQTKCRHCGDTQCSGRCWGFFGLKRKERLDAKSIHPTDPPRVSNLDNSHSTSFPKRKRPFVVVDHRRDAHIAELVQLNIALSPNEFRDPSSGVRVPHCCTRILRTSTKAKWFGQSVLNVIQSEFIELRRTDVLQNVLAHGLLRLNNKTVPALDVSKLQLTSADTIERIVHWHEAPVIVPARIAVEKVQLPSTVLKEYEIDEEEPVFVYVCNKPSTLPTHPAGPYLSNSLTMMVEGQEGLTPQSLSPLHRTDRVTSGLTLCSTSSAVSRIFQKSLLDGTVEKLYIAKVGGQFPSSLTQANVAESSNTGLNSEYCMWSADGLFLTVDAPIFTADAAAGLRRIDVKLGKPSQSRFRLLHYDPERDSSLVACFPITGRNHQLRVHLQMLGHPILNDVQYGGRRESVYSTGKVTENSVVQAMLDVIKKSNQETDRRVQSLSEDDAAAAKRACPCCRTANEDGIRQSFTPAQLLVEGHAICLHALRYRATFLRSKPKNVPIEGILANGIEASDQLGELDFKVDPPDWASKEALSEIDCIEFH